MIVLIITIYAIALMMCLLMHHTIDTDRPRITNRLMIATIILSAIDIVLILRLIL